MIRLTHDLDRHMVKGWLDWPIVKGWLDRLMVKGWLDWPLVKGWLDWPVVKGWLDRHVVKGWLDEPLVKGWLDQLMVKGWLDWPVVKGWLLEGLSGLCGGLAPACDNGLWVDLLRDKLLGLLKTQPTVRHGRLNVYLHARDSHKISRRF